MNEIYLDRHLHNKHDDYNSNTTVCLADYCSILGCQSPNGTYSLTHSILLIYLLITKNYTRNVTRMMLKDYNINAKVY